MQHCGVTGRDAGGNLRLNANGEGDKIVTERFEVIEQVHDCRVLFEQLQASLSSSWEHYFSEASIYYVEHGDLNIPKRYTTPAGLSLGEWLTTQRRVRAGQIPGNLTEQQIARLDSIGMEWGNRNDAAWNVVWKKRENFGNSLGICRSRRNTKRKMTILWESGSTMRGNAETIES